MRVTLVACFLAGICLGTLPALAEREHTVRSGQSLSRIARRYRVTVQDLAAANQLRVTSELREGQRLRIPDRGVHYVRSGETLSRIAQRRNTSVRALARANRLRPDARLRLGQRLVLPGHDSIEERDRAEARWGRPRHPGIVTFFRVAMRERLRVRLINSSGAVRRGPRRRLAHLMRHRRTNRQSLPNRRLVRVLTQISDHFGGRTLNILSGYRPAGGQTNEGSRHVSGEAVDLRVQGVSNRILRDYARTLDRVGVGYYPNSTFVHVDVRDRKAYWVDRSGRGESADYVRDRAAREQVDPGESDAPSDASGSETSDSN
ncbi:MAG: LysM peptidoglycan-binding domain-containing protein [Myxococcota bacterium]